MESDSMSLIIIVLCIVMSAYFSATETAFSSLNRIRVKNMAEKGNQKAALVLQLSDQYDRLLSTILIGNNIVNILSASLSTLLFVRLLGAEFGASASTVVITIVVLIFGEVSPKSIAKESPEAFAMFSAPIIRVLMVVMTPLNFLFAQWKKLLSKIVKSNDDKGITEEELLTIVEEAEEDGGIDEQESTLIRSAIEFTELEAGDILTPRVEVTGIELGTPEEEIAQLFIETGYSRMPVYEETIDNIVGIIYQKDFYKTIYHKQGNMNDIIRSALFITKNRKIGELLKDLQQSKQHIAVVLDEFGGTVGIVTLEDILEELVGEIWDEHDTIVNEIEQISEKEYLVQGSTDIEKLFEVLGKEDVAFEFHTVNGWVTEVLGRLAEEGDHFVYENLDVTVVTRSEKRVEQVRVIVKPETEDQEHTEE